MMWTSFHDYVLLGVDSLLVSVLYAIYRRRDQVIKNIAMRDARCEMRENILKQRSKIDLEGLSTCQTCTVCLGNPREVILLNCGHVCVCADCCVKLSRKCPICRETIMGTHAAYIV